MKIIIDADGCPVTSIASEEAKSCGAECIAVCDTAHEFHLDGVSVITVSKGADSADYKIANLVGNGDIVVTQDYGLATMCLARNAHAINQNGMRYTAENIDGLLFSRHVAKKVRNAGGRIKGPAKRKPTQNDDFRRELRRLIDDIRSE